MPLDTNVSSDLRPTFRMKVTRVEVSALVVDAEGKPVRDLKASEFEVYDGGRKQNIQSFAAYTYNGGSIPAGHRRLAERPEQRSRARHQRVEFVVAGHRAADRRPAHRRAPDARRRAVPRGT